MWGLGILKGMVITMRNMLRGPITVQYPDERIELPERARWAVAPKYDEEGRPKCTACTNCVRACPDGILGLDVTTAEDKTKHIDEFTYELGACMMCGLCVEACPFDALEMSHDYELSVTDPEDMMRMLLCDVDAASGKRARAEAAEAKPRKADGPVHPVAETPAPQEPRKADGGVPEGQEPAAPVPEPEPRGDGGARPSAGEGSADD